jgi:hypothetical protein
MRAKTKGKHEMGKRFALVIGVAAVGVMALGAQSVIAKHVMVRPNGNKVTSRAMAEVSSEVSLDVSGAIDRQGAVTYAFGGDIRAQAQIRGAAFDPKGAAGGGGNVQNPACSELRTVTLFRVEPNGTSTRVASVRTGRATDSPHPGEFGGPLARPLGEITGHYYVEVAPATLKASRDLRTKRPGRVSSLRRLVKFYKVGGRYYRALSCLPARSPTIFVEVPAGLSNSQ